MIESLGCFVFSVLLEPRNGLDQSTSSATENGFVGMGVAVLF